MGGVDVESFILLRLITLISLICIYATTHIHMYIRTYGGVYKYIHVCMTYTFVYTYMCINLSTYPAIHLPSIIHVYYKLLLYTYIYTHESLSKSALSTS